MKGNPKSLVMAWLIVMAVTPKRASAEGWERRGNIMGNILEVSPTGIVANNLSITDSLQRGLYLSKDFGHTWEKLISGINIEQAKPLKTNQKLLIRFSDKFGIFDLKTREIQYIDIPDGINVNKAMIVDTYGTRAILKINSETLISWDLETNKTKLLWPSEENSNIDAWTSRKLERTIVQTNNAETRKTYISVDGGDSWREIQGLRNIKLRDIAFTNNYGFALTRDIGTAVVTDTGDIVRWIGPADGQSGKELDIVGNTLIAVSQEGDTKVNIYSSSDWGETWQDTAFWDGQARLSFGYKLNLGHYWDGYQLTEVLIHPYLGMFALPIPHQTQIKPILGHLWKGQGPRELETKITAYFDHAYPLLGTSRVKEPKSTTDTTTNYKGKTAKEPELYYSGHNGIDFGLPYGTEITTPLAGVARRVYCRACGNTILIEHDNGYKTLYMHLQEKDLITTSYVRIPVAQGETIGRVGMSGNTTGPHLHFSVIQPSPADTTDYLPNLVDPFGWQDPTSMDPWEIFGWKDYYDYKHGAKSKYLWAESSEKHIAQYKGTETTILWKNLGIQIPGNATLGPTTGATFQIDCFDITGASIHELNKQVTIKVKIIQDKLTDIDPNTLRIYHLVEGHWQKLQGDIDTTTLEINGKTTTLSKFAVFGEKLTQKLPETTIEIEGAMNKFGWFVEYPEIRLISNDPTNKTFVSLGDELWKEYETPIKIREDGISKVYYRGMNSLGDVEPTKEIWLYVNTARKPTSIGVVEGVGMRIKQ